MKQKWVQDPRLKPAIAAELFRLVALSGLTEVGVMVSESNKDQTTGHGMFLRRNKLFNFLPEPVKVGTFGAPAPAKLRYQRGSETRSDEST